VGPAVDENGDGDLGELVAGIGEDLRAEQRAELADGEDLAVGRPCFWRPAVAAWVRGLGSSACAGGLARYGTQTCAVVQVRTGARAGMPSWPVLEPGLTPGLATAGPRRCSGSQAWPVWALVSDVTVRFTRGGARGPRTASARHHR
jgi:hypothetical protein